MRKIIAENIQPLRSALLLGECRRILHGRGQAFPGHSWVHIDAYPPLISVGLYPGHTVTEPNSFLAQILTAVNTALQKELFTAGVLRDRGIAGAPIQATIGEVPEKLSATENALSYVLRPRAGQNIGLFMDARSIRRWLSTQDNVRGKKILNLFSYTCSFSVAAMAGGADRVVNMDMKKGFLSTGRESHGINGHDTRRVGFLPHNILKSWAALQKAGPFDLIICDPPSNQGGSFTLQRDYPKVLGRLPGLLCGPDSRAILCTNDPDLSVDAFVQMLCAHGFHPEFRFDVPLDFPEKNPDAGLKAFLCAPATGAI